METLRLFVISLLMASFIVLAIYLLSDLTEGHALKERLRKLFFRLPLSSIVFLAVVIFSIFSYETVKRENASKNGSESYKEPNAYFYHKEEGMSDREYTEYRLKVKKDHYDKYEKDATIQMSNDSTTNNILIKVPHQAIELTVKTVDGVTKVLDHHGELLKEYR